MWKIQIMPMALQVRKKGLEILSENPNPGFIFPLSSLYQQHFVCCKLCKASCQNDIDHLMVTSEWTVGVLSETETSGDVAYDLVL